MDQESVCSVRLSWLIDKIIGTEEEVTIKRKVDGMKFYTAIAGDNCGVILSGSRAEGLQFKSSDFDFMHVLQDVIVLNSSRDKETIDSCKNKTVLLMRREGCSPGFVYLQCLSKDAKGWIYNIVVKSMVQYHGMAVLSSHVMRDNLIEARFISYEPHGPCITESVGTTEFDYAICFACRIWPLEAYNFIHRHRPYGCPSNDLIDRIVQNGCHLVGIGDPKSEISLIQWRLSFSAAEKLLIHNFNHTQLKVYALLKIFLKQAINKNESVKDLLCSYFLKTAVFYSMETTPQSFWTEELLISCFCFCCNKLITWVEQGNCPNYFVPENNMFRNKVYGERRQNLLRVLNRYKRQGWTCLCQCEDLKPLKAIVKRPQIGAEYQLTNEREREESMDAHKFGKLMCMHIQIVNNASGVSKCLRSSLQLLAHSRSRDEEFMASYITCATFQNVVKFYMSKLNSGTNVTNNKSRYLLMRKCKMLLSIATVLDLSTKYLTNATFYYTVGNYKKSLQLCEQMLLCLKPMVSYEQSIYAYIPRVYKDFVCGRGLSNRDKLTRAWTCDVSIAEHVKAFFPKELHHFAQATYPSDLCIPPLPYMAFLMFLCHHKLGNIDSSLSTLHDLRTLVHDEVQGGRRNHIVFSLLAICLQKLGDVRGAIEACVNSLQREPNGNGALKLLDELMREEQR